MHNINEQGITYRGHAKDMGTYLYILALDENIKRIAALFRQMLYDFVILQLLYLFHISLLGIQRMNLHTPPKCGPLMTVELKNNIIVHWRPHGVPLRFGQIMPITDLHYISNDIDEIAGGPHAVIVLHICYSPGFSPNNIFTCMKWPKSASLLLHC